MTYRRNAFAPEEVASRPMPSKAAVEPGERIRPSVSADVARVAEYLCSDTVTQEIFARLKKEAVAKLMASEPGASGATEREIARYELQALDNIEARLQSIASELRLFDKPETLGDETAA